jgi:hypothetical protein
MLVGLGDLSMILIDAESCNTDCDAPLFFSGTTRHQHGSSVCTHSPCSTVTFVKCDGTQVPMTDCCATPTCRRLHQRLRLGNAPTRHVPPSQQHLWASTTTACGYLFVQQGHSHPAPQGMTAVYESLYMAVLSSHVPRGGGGPQAVAERSRSRRPWLGETEGALRTKN